MSEGRRSLLSADGAHLILTPDTKGMGGAIHKAEELQQEHSDYFMPQQFNNPANPDAHRNTTAIELLQQFKRIDAFVAGVGTGGTITGVGEVLKDKRKASVYAPLNRRIACDLGRRTGYTDPRHRRRFLFRRSSIVRFSTKHFSEHADYACTRRLAAEEGPVGRRIYPGALPRRTKDGKTWARACRARSSRIKVSITETDLFADKNGRKVRKTRILSESDHARSIFGRSRFDISLKAARCAWYAGHCATASSRPYPPARSMTPKSLPRVSVVTTSFAIRMNWQIRHIKKIRSTAVFSARTNSIESAARRQTSWV
jgi:hypothetical protein